MRTARVVLFTQPVMLPVVVDGIDARATPPPTTAADTAPPRNATIPVRRIVTRPAMWTPASIGLSGTSPSAQETLSPAVIPERQRTAARRGRHRKPCPGQLPI